MFLPECERQSFTPTQKNMQKYSSVRVNIYIFGRQIGRQNILHRKQTLPDCNMVLIFSASLYGFELRGLEL